MREDVEFLKSEIERLKSGKFTEEEFQNLCHNFDTKDAERFCTGCEEYQKSLFGKSPISELREKYEKTITTLKLYTQRNDCAYALATLAVLDIEVEKNESNEWYFDKYLKLKEQCQK